MKVLFVTSKDGDYVANCLWDGLQELLGEDNVIDAIGSPLLHNNPAIPDICWHISGTRQGVSLANCVHNERFDMMVVNACVLREVDWHFPNMLRETRLKQGAKIAFVEGWDGPLDINPPPFHVDAVFRREMQSRIAYPYKPHCLLMAAPARWFCYNNQRTLDVFCAAYSIGWDYRWDSCRMAFSTKRKHQSLISSCGALGFESYANYMRTAKLALCPAGAGDTSSDCMRTWEAVSRGAIPVFIGYADRIRDPWFESDECFWCPDVKNLPDVIDRALGINLDSMRIKMQANARHNHTTKARAQKVLDVLGMTP